MIKVAALIIVISICFGVSINGQQSEKHIKHDMPGIVPTRDYDARIFLSRTQKITFKRLYPDFDEPRAEKNWEWKDIDPLGLYSAEENRGVGGNCFYTNTLPRLGIPQTANRPGSS